MNGSIGTKTAAPDCLSAKTDRDTASTGQSPRRLFRSLVVVALLAGGLAWWKTGGEDRFVPKRFGVVVPGRIYRSGQISKWLIEDVLVHHEIQAIIDFNGFDWNDEHQQAELAVAWKHKIAVTRFAQSGDGTGDIYYYAQAIKIMHDFDRAGRPILVHCAAGSQRTGAAVAFYRLLVQKWPPKDALLEMQRYDCIPQENARLIDYLNGNMEKLAGMLVTMDVIKRVPAALPHLDP